PHLLYLAAAAVRDEPVDVVQGPVPADRRRQRDAVRNLVQRSAARAAAGCRHAALGQGDRRGVAHFLVRGALFRSDAAVSRSESPLGRIIPGSSGGLYL